MLSIKLQIMLFARKWLGQITHEIREIGNAIYAPSPEPVMDFCGCSAYLL